VFLLFLFADENLVSAGTMFGKYNHSFRPKGQCGGAVASRTESVIDEKFTVVNENRGVSSG
jgi:hypothetical protein